jgi:hypothetical protein
VARRKKLLRLLLKLRLLLPLLLLPPLKLLRLPLRLLPPPLKLLRLLLLRPRLPNQPRSNLSLHQKSQPAGWLFCSRCTAASS